MITRKTSPEGQGISEGFPPFKHTGYALKVKGNTALPVLDNTV